MSEPIDFSDRENEFLDGDLKQRALAVALFTSVAGFILSSWLFLDRRVGPASELLDRRAAERGVTVKLKQSKAESSYSYSAFVPPTVKRASRSERRRARPAWKDLPVVLASDDKEGTTSQEKKTVKVLETTIGEVPEYIRTPTPSKRTAATKPKPKPKPKKTVIDESPERLLYPTKEARAENQSLSAIASQVSANVIEFQDSDGKKQVGVGIDRDGRAFISDRAAQWGKLDRVWLNGSLHQASVLARDREFGLALIQVERASFDPLALAPSPPALGEPLLGFVVHGDRAETRTGTAGTSFGKAGYFVDIGISPSTAGVPLFNSRGELCGFYSMDLPGAPGGGFQLASDSSVLYRLVRGYSNRNGSIDSSLADATLRLSQLAKAHAETATTKRGRILPGVGLSDLKIGASSKEVERWVSTPQKHRLGADLESWTSPAPPVSLYFAHDTLVAATTDHNSFATADGLSPGLTLQLREFTRNNPQSHVYPGRISLPGLDLMLGVENKILGFTVKIDLVSR